MTSEMQHAAFHRFAASHGGATFHLVLGFVAALGLTPANVRGQDRIRIVEEPRTAMRESRSAPSAVRTNPDRPEPVQPSRGVVAGQSSTPLVEHFVTEMQDQFRTVYVPVIENQTEPSPAWWNPLGLSTGTFRSRPVVRWEPRVEKVRVAVRYRELAPESVDRVELRPKSPTRPMPVAPPALGNPARAAARPTTAPNEWPIGSQPAPLPAARNPSASEYGGISRLESDLPRRATRPGIKDRKLVR